MCDLNVKQLKLLLAPLKRKEDGAMPTRKKDILEKLVLWEGRAVEVENGFGRELVARDEEGEEASNEESDEELEGFI